MYAALDRLLRLRARPILNVGDLDTTLAGNLFHRDELTQAIHRRAHHVVRIRGAEALRENIRDTGALHDGANGATRNHTGTRRCGLHQNLPGSVLANDLVRNRVPRERDWPELATRGVHGLANGFGDFVCLARGKADASRAIADRDERVERKAPAALHDLRDAINGDHVLDEIATLARPLVAAALSAASFATAMAALTTAIAAAAVTAA